VAANVLLQSPPSGVHLLAELTLQPPRLVHRLHVIQQVSVLRELALAVRTPEVTGMLPHVNPEVVAPCEALVAFSTPIW